MGNARLGAIAVAATVLGVAVSQPEGPGLVTPAAAQVAPRNQTEPDLVFVEERREFILVWTEDRGSGSRIYAKRLSANGLPRAGTKAGSWEATRLAPGATPGEQRWPAIIAGLLVYSEKPPGAADYDLFAQRLFDNARPNGLPRRIVQEPGDQKYPDVVAISRTRGVDYLVVWSEDTRDQGDVMGLRLDFALRRSRGPAFPIARGPGTAEDPAVERDPFDAEDLLVMFTDDRNGNRDIFGVRLADSGLPRGGPAAGPFPVIEAPEDDYAPHLLSSLDPSSRRPESNLLLAWTRDDVADGADVLGRRLERNGLPRGAAIKLAAGTGEQSWPAGARRHLEFDERRGLRERDEWLVAWQDDALGNLDIRGLRVGLQGQRLTGARWLVAD